MSESARKVVPAGAAVGSLVSAVLYAATGAVAAMAVSGTVVFGVVLVVPATFWLVGRMIEGAGRSNRNRGALVAAPGKRPIERR